MLLGLVTGLASGLLGIGGAPILVPGMVYLLGVDQKTAQGISLAVLIPTALVGATTHYRHGNVITRYVVWLVPAAIIGAVVGAFLVAYVDALLLKRLFGVFLLIIAARMIIQK
ncbi:MAG: sulfite exporter TauE/SafE family protein [Chloroflexi bacterium]|nr:sulfite exporter TauE/SafE family protein [Chloroflexota bacterium]